MGDHIVVPISYSAASSTSVNHVSVSFTGAVSGVGALSVLNAAVADFSPAAGGPVTLTLPSLVLSDSASSHSSTLTGSDSFIVNGPLSWANSGITGSGSITTYGTVTADNVGLDGRDFINQGDFQWTSNIIDLAAGARFDNYGTFEAQNTAYLVRDLNGDTNGFYNYGTVSSTSTVANAGFQIAFYNSGSVTVHSGSLTFNGGGSSTGSFSGDTGTTLAFAPYTFQSGSISADSVHFGGALGDPIVVPISYSAASSTTMSFVSVSFTGTVSSVGALGIDHGAAADFSPAAGGPVTLTLPSLTLTGSGSASTLTGSDSFIVNGSVSWTFGNITGSGSITTYGTVTADNIGVYGRDFINQGDFRWTNYMLEMDSGARFDNYGTFEVLNTATQVFDPSGNTYGFHNYGTVTATINAGFHIAFSNSGTVDVQSGTLNLGSQYVQTAGSTLLDGGNISGELNIQGGTLRGSGTITGDVTSAGTLVPTAPPAPINVTGNYSQSTTGAFQATISGPSAGSQYSQLGVTGTVQLAGALNVSLSSFAPATGSTFTILNNQGAGAISGTFANLPQGAFIPAGAGAFQINYQGSAGNSVVLTYFGTAVTNTNDSGPGSLRQAILDTNAIPGTDAISFNIPTSDPGYNSTTGTFTIALLSALPAITDPVILDGWSQPGFTNRPLIELNGAQAGAGADGLVLSAGGSTVRGLVIGGFAGAGIDVQSSNNVIQGNYIGTDVTGTVALANSTNGVEIEQGAQFNLIGTNGDGVNDTAERNIISGNLQRGVYIHDTGTDHNVVAGDYIGTDVTGSIALGNGTPNNWDPLRNCGVLITNGAQYNRIGTSGAEVDNVGERNVISGNLLNGVIIDGAGSDHNIVAGNYIGTDATGEVVVQNEGHGIVVHNGPQYTQIGTNGDGIGDAFEGNLVSGNGGYSIVISADYGLSTDNNVVAGNLLGTDATGTVALGLSINYAGVAILGGDNNRIGTNGDGVSDALERNVIVGHGDHAGIVVGGGNGGNGHWLGGSGNVIAGNYIGTDLTGKHALGSLDSDIWLSYGAVNTRIGTNPSDTDAAAEANVIANAQRVGNDGHGIYLQGDINTVITGNYIGTDVTGTVALPNQKGGIFVYTDTQGTRIGYDGSGVGQALQRNIISGNTGPGVTIDYTSTTTVAGNYIGTDVTGTVALGNTDGVYIRDGAHNNTIGGVIAGDRNIISGNTADGVDITDSGSDANVIEGNYIGTDVTGTVALGNGKDGVALYNGPQYTQIGTNGDGVNDAAEGNLISGNQLNGVLIEGDYGRPSTDNNVVAGNLIGTDATGTVVLDNGSASPSVYSGVKIAGGSNNRIGTNGDGVSDALERNIIVGKNNGVGINLAGRDGSGFPLVVSGNIIAGNYIGTDVTGTHALGAFDLDIQVGLGVLNTRIGTNPSDTDAAAEANVIAGAQALYRSYDGQGILIQGATNTVVTGNYIGTDVSGTVALANQGGGIRVGSNYYATQGTRIGCDGSGVGQGLQRNIISGNTGPGVTIDFTSPTIIAGNYIGTDVTGKLALANTEGVLIENAAADNTIGGFLAGTGNLIAGNTGDGVDITGLNTNANVVEGNYIGTNVTATAALGNGTNGVEIQRGAQSNLIGTNGDGVNDAAERNIISGNRNDGVFIHDTYTNDNVVAGNFIGLDATGTIAIYNGTPGPTDYTKFKLCVGVIIANGAQYNRVGTSGAEVDNVGERNVISGNIRSGVVVADPGSDHNVIAGNYIGTDVTGEVAVGNEKNGIALDFGPQYTQIGTNGDGVGDAFEGNLISGNLANGVQLYSMAGQFTDYNVIAGNRIGTDATGTVALGNGAIDSGVLIVGGSHNRVGTNGDGTSDALERNIIVGNN